MMRRLSKRQQEKAPEGHASQDDEAASKAQPGPAPSEKVESKFKEVM